MIDAMLRAVPLPFYNPLRQAIIGFSRGNPLRLASTVVLRRAAHAYRSRLAAHLGEIRPLDAPSLSFEVADSMVMDAVFWFGIRGYEGTVARVWAALCASSRATLEIGGNVGLFTVVGAQATSGSYTVVEPVPEVAAILRANLARNRLTHVQVLQAAAVAGGPSRDVVLNIPEEGRAMTVGAHLLDGVEVAGRGSKTQLVVRGLPMGELAAGCDLIKIDAEGIESALLSDIRGMLVRERPSLLIEVLPEATRLGEMLSGLATEAGYRVYILPEYGSDTVVEVPAASFTSILPLEYKSKDVVLSTRQVA